MDTLVTRLSSVLGSERYTEVTYVGMDGGVLDVGGHLDEPLDPPATPRHPMFDLLTALRAGLPQDKEEAFWRELEQVSLHDHSCHDSLDLVFLYMLFVGRATLAVDWFFNSFHLCRANTISLVRLGTFLDFCAHYLTNETLMRIGDLFFALQDNQEVKHYYALTSKKRKTEEQEERNTAAVIVISQQYLIQPTLGKALKRRLEKKTHLQKPDTRSVVAMLEILGCSPQLRNAWWRFERDWATADDDFGYQTAIVLSRAFMEALAFEAVIAVAQSGLPGLPPTARPAEVRGYLSRPEVSVLSAGEGSLIAAIYGHLSRVAVHALGTPREEALACRNLAIEGALIILNGLHRRMQQVQGFDEGPPNTGASSGRRPR